MANILTLKILEGLSCRMNKNGSPSNAKSCSPSSSPSSAPSARSSAPAKAVSLDSLTSSLGAAPKAAPKSSNLSNSSRPASGNGGSVASDYETAIKSLIDKTGGPVSSSKSTQKPAPKTSVKSGTVGLDDLIKTLGR
jgi:hypothetical protein